MESEGLLSAKEALELLPGMTYARLMRLAKNGEVPSIQYGAGTRRYFVRSELVAFAKASGVSIKES